MSKLKKKFLNAQAALAKLKEFRDSYTGKEIERAGIIQAFEFTFEPFWQMFRVCAEEAGNSKVMGPRDAFKFAYSKGLIDSESVWLAMIPERNDSVHSYNEAVSERVYLKVVQEFIGAFERSESAVALFFGY